jgi:hypothetical protein
MSIMGKQFLSARKLSSFEALVQVVIENPFGGTSTFSTRLMSQMIRYRNRDKGVNIKLGNPMTKS